MRGVRGIGVTGRNQDECAPTFPPECTTHLSELRRSDGANEALRVSRMLRNIVRRIIRWSYYDEFTGLE